MMPRSTAHVSIADMADSLLSASRWPEARATFSRQSRNSRFTRGSSSAAIGKSLLHPDDPYIVAVISDAALPDAPIPVVGFDDPEAIIDLLIANAAPLSAVVARERTA